MISPWTIYWIMQLDNIGCALGAVAFLSGAASVVLLVIAGCKYSANPDEWTSPGLKSSANRALEQAPKLKGFAIRLVLLAFLPSLFCSALLPSSRTAAAMVLIPAIANNETVQKEAGELYQLAKDGLRELVKPEKE